jgi:hypothetical protein
MAIHIAALRQDSLSYEEFTRRALEQETVAQQQSTTCMVAEQQPSLSQIRVSSTLSSAPNIGSSLEIAGYTANRNADP